MEQYISDADRLIYNAVTAEILGAVENASADLYRIAKCAAAIATCHPLLIASTRAGMTHAQFVKAAGLAERAWRRIEIRASYSAIAPAAVTTYAPDAGASDLVA